MPVWVLMTMTDHADHEAKNVYPGVRLLAWKTGYTIRQIRRILAILQEKGLIIVQEEGRDRKTTRYRLDLASADRKVSSGCSTWRAEQAARCGAG